jgi:ABC-2 type transport system ATP-binding protein
MIQAIGIKKKYGNVEAVKGISLSMGSHEILGVIGPNGAGKSTLLKTIVGILEPDEGTVTIDEVFLRDDPVRYKKMLGYVPDEPYIYDKLQGIEFLHFVAEMKGVQRNDAEIAISELLTVFSLDEKKNELIGNYSHGMRKKIVLASALLGAPKYLILDEPTDGLDPLSIHAFKQIIKMKSAEQVGIMISTHILGMAEELCNRVVFLNKGEVITDISNQAHDGSSGRSILEDQFLKAVERCNGNAIPK